VTEVPDDDRVRRVRQYWAQAWSAGDVDLLEQFYADRFRENDDELTPQQFAAHLLAWRERFPDFRAEVVRVWTTPDAVMTRVVYTGTHRADFSFLPATHRSFRSSGLDVFEFDEHDRVVQHWHETDHWELFEQLGATVVGS
jgi:steroid delta-isomerase-like uncharacterized protein